MEKIEEKYTNRFTGYNSSPDDWYADDPNKIYLIRDKAEYGLLSQIKTLTDTMSKKEILEEFKKFNFLNKVTPNPYTKEDYEEWLKQGYIKFSKPIVSGLNFYYDISTWNKREKGYHEENYEQVYIGWVDAVALLKCSKCYNGESKEYPCTCENREIENTYIEYEIIIKLQMFNLAYTDLFKNSTFYELDINDTESMIVETIEEVQDYLAEFQADVNIAVEEARQDNKYYKICSECGNILSQCECKLCKTCKNTPYHCDCE